MRGYLGHASACLVGFASLLLLGAAPACAADLVLPAPPEGSPPTACAPVATPGVSMVTLTETFRDNFDDFEPLGRRWRTHYNHNPGTYWQSRTLEPNVERQIYVDPGYTGSGSAPLGLDPFSVSDGVLTIRAKPVPEDLRATLHDFPYMSGMLNSTGTFTQLYGYFEIRARLPSGQGIWPAFWLLRPGMWPPEIDVMEYLGGRPTTIHSTVHWSGASQPEASGCKTERDDLTTAFHTYGVLWRAEDLTFYIDRVPVGRIASKPGLDEPMYMLANLAVGGKWGGDPDATTPFPADYQIDWIAAYAVAPSGTRATGSPRQ